MNFEQIHYILELTKHKSISSAAKQLHLSQPSLTMIINKVEDELNIKLFDRTYNGIQLTAAGEQALPYLQSLSHTYKLMQETLHSTGEKFVLGLSAGTFYLIQPMFKKIKSLFHTFQIESIDFEENIIDSVKNHQFDLSIITATQFEQLDKQKFTYIPFMESKVVALSSKACNKSVLSVADFKSKNIVLFKQQDIEQYVRQTPNFIHQVASYISTVNGDLIRQLLMEENFFHITLENALQHFEPRLLEQLHLYSIQEMDHTFEYGWLYLKDTPKTTKIDQLLKSI